MSDDDEIKPGDRFERVVGSIFGHVVKGGIYTVLAKVAVADDQEAWSLEELSRGHVFYDLSNTDIWRRLPRTDATAVKVGDVVKDPALLQAGVYGYWADNDGTPALQAFHLGPPFAGSQDQCDLIRRIGMKITALPEPPKAEAVKFPLYCHPCRELGTACQEHAEADVAPPPTRCESGCTPKEPCRMPGACPVFKEEHVAIMAAAVFGARGISPDLPPARATTYQPRCAELAGYGSWNGREGK